MSTEERHITRMLKTEALFRTNGDQGQSAILTDQNEEWVYYNSGKSKLYYQASQKYWDGAAWTYCDVDFGEITLHDDLLIDEYIKRVAGSDDYIRFENDKITIAAGGNTAAIFEDDSITFSKIFSAITGSTIGTLTLGDGSITDSSGAISFGDENLSTTGTLGAGQVTATKINLGGGLTAFILNGVSLDAVVGATSEIATELHYVALQHSNTALAGTRFMYGRSRGTLATPLIVQDNDVIAALDAAAFDGTDYVLAGQIDFEVDGTPGSNDMPGRIVFKTTADGGVLPTTRWTIDSTGHLLSGTDGTGAFNIATAGSITGNSFITAQNIGIVGDLDIIQLTGANLMRINAGVGIGTAPLDYRGIEISYASTSITGNNIGINGSYTWTPSANTTRSLWGLYFNSEIAGTYNARDITSIEGRITLNGGSGSLRDLKLIKGSFYPLTTIRTVTRNVYGIDIGVSGAGAAVAVAGDSYQMRLIDFTTWFTIAGIKYGIYQYGADHINIFQGEIQIASDTNGTLYGAGGDSKAYDDGSYMIFDCDNQSVTGREFKFLNGNIWLDNARQAGAPTPDGYLLVKDSTGTQYKIPCEAA